MKKNVQNNVGFGPDDSERMDEYWDGNRQEEDLPGYTGKTGQRKAGSKAKGRANRRQPMAESQRDDFAGDSDLD